MKVTRALLVALVAFASVGTASVSAAEASSELTGVACVPACKLAGDAAKALCKLQKPSHRERCKENADKIEHDCELACQLVKSEAPAFVAAPGPVTPPACQMACHKGEYDLVQACAGDAECVAKVKATVAQCMATCPTPEQLGQLSASRNEIICKMACAGTEDLARTGCNLMDKPADCLETVKSAKAMCDTACGLLDAPAPVPALAVSPAPVSVAAPKPMLGGVACQAACEATKAACALLCNLYPANLKQPCRDHLETGLTICNLACLLEPLFVTAPATKEIAPPAPVVAAEPAVPESQEVTLIGTPAHPMLGGPACLAACKAASAVAKAACHLQKPSHQQRCKENVAKVEKDCELACMIIPTVAAEAPVVAESKPMLGSECTAKCWATYDQCDAACTKTCATSPNKFGCISSCSTGCYWTASDCAKPCDPFVSSPGPVTPPACQMACHKGEYAKTQACGSDAACVAKVKSDVAACDAACPAPEQPTAMPPTMLGLTPKQAACQMACIGLEATEKYACNHFSSDPKACLDNVAAATKMCNIACEVVKSTPPVVESSPVSGPACVPACKLAADAAKALCKLQKKEHRERCQENCDKVEKDCELACQLVKSEAPVVAESSVESLTEDHYREQFSAFVKKHSKKYTHDEFFPRYTIFKANYNKIRHHNANGKATYTMAVNEFADMTFAEFHKKMTGYNRVDKSVLRAKNTEGPHMHLKAPLAQSVDWRQKNAVTPVKNQQQCGSCWSFSATGSMEGAHAIKTGNLVSLSEQQLVDCSSAQGNQGCNGGLMDQAFQYVISNNGITTEAAYPYTAQQGTCQTNMTAAATISSFVDVTSGDEKALMAAVNIGPVSIAIEADQQCFQFYSGGVLSDPSCGTQLDHGVLVVGYGTDSTTNQDYWIVKNSWGATWGEQGYIRLVRGSNECGIATEPSYPVV